MGPSTPLLSLFPHPSPTLLRSLFVRSRLIDLPLYAHVCMCLASPSGFQAYIYSLPTFILNVLNYLGNVVLLWTIIILLLLALYSGLRRLSITKSDLKNAAARLKMEKNEKMAIIRTHNIKFDEEAEEGRTSFKEFMMEELGVRAFSAIFSHACFHQYSCLSSDASNSCNSRWTLKSTTTQ
jgi:hypothetical protein